jgi:hypothetical protein
MVDHDSDVESHVEDSVQLVCCCFAVHISRGWMGKAMEGVCKEIMNANLHLNGLIVDMLIQRLMLHE